MLAHRQISRPQRWDNPFDGNLTDDDVEYILNLPLFKGMDAEQFPNHLPLSGIVKNDMRLGVCQRGDILVREGDYGNSAFLVLDGKVTVILPPGLSDLARGESQAEKLSWVGSLKRYLQRSPYPEVRLSGDRYITESTALRGKDSETRVYLKDPESVKRNHSHVFLVVGELFGEVAALARTPRNTTIFAEEDVWFLEIRWQGLRDIRRYVESFHQHLDALYQNGI